jgi:hypothetical protein
MYSVLKVHMLLDIIWFSCESRILVLRVNATAR